jgi:hypothetical protein
LRSWGVMAFLPVACQSRPSCRGHIKAKEWLRQNIHRAAEPG